MHSSERVSAGQRQAKLQALGVTQWFARARLPGAAPTRFDLLPVSAGQGAVKTSGLASPAGVAAPLSASGLGHSSDAAAGKETAKQLLREVAAPQKADRAPSPPADNQQGGEPVSKVGAIAGSAAGETQVSSSVAASLDGLAAPQAASTDSLDATANLSRDYVPVELHLSLYEMSGWLICSAESAGQWEPAEASLLQNILRACKVSAEDLRFVGELTWPVFNSRQLPTSDASSLQECMAQWLSKHSGDSVPSRQMLCFGDPLNLFKDESALPAEKRVVLSHSLADLLAMPVRKAQVWRELQSYLPLGAADGG